MTKRKRRAADLNSNTSQRKRAKAYVESEFIARFGHDPISPAIAQRRRRQILAGKLGREAQFEAVRYINTYLYNNLHMTLEEVEESYIQTGLIAIEPQAPAQ